MTLFSHFFTILFYHFFCHLLLFYHFIIFFTFFLIFFNHFFSHLNIIQLQLFISSLLVYNIPFYHLTIFFIFFLNFFYQFYFHLLLFFSYSRNYQMQIQNILFLLIIHTHYYDNNTNFIPELGCNVLYHNIINFYHHCNVLYHNIINYYHHFCPFYYIILFILFSHIYIITHMKFNFILPYKSYIIITNYYEIIHYPKYQ